MKRFADTLPADLRESAVFKDIKDLDGLARSYANAAKMVGMDKGRIVAIPAEDDAAGWNDFFAKAGRPEKPDGYGLKPPAGVTVDDKLQAAFTAKAHEAGLTTKQASALYDWWNGAAAEARAGMEGASAEALKAGETALKAEWGAAYDQNLDLATKAFAHYGNPALKAELEKTGQGNSPELLKVFAKLGKQLSEDGLIGKATGGGEAIASPTEARQQIAAKKADPVFVKAYIDKTHPGHMKAVQEMAALHEQAYPTAA